MPESIVGDADMDIVQVTDKLPGMRSPCPNIMLRL